MDKFLIEVLIETTGEHVKTEIVASSEREAESMYKNSIRWDGYKLKDLKVIKTTKLTNTEWKKLG